MISLFQSLRMNGIDPYACLKHVPHRLPTQWASDIAHCCLIKGSPGINQGSSAQSFQPHDDET